MVTLDIKYPACISLLGSYPYAHRPCLQGILCEETAGIYLGRMERIRFDSMATWTTKSIDQSGVHFRFVFHFTPTVRQRQLQWQLGNGSSSAQRNTKGKLVYHLTRPCPTPT